MTRIHIFKTNRRIKPSVYLTATKEQDGKLGSIEMYHQTDIDDILEENFYVDAGSNVKMWQGIADELNKPGVFDKLAKFISSSHRGQK